MQAYINENFYTCSNDILKELGEMYVCDDRFKKNIDRFGGEGTAEFVRDAISIYCDK
ncbi:MAG: TipAS antibiotic-recognition domain-containing protein [Lachnospiraceae bacterium]